MKNIIIGICLLLGLAACQKEERLDANFSMEVKGFIEQECYTFGEPQALYLWSTKSWADGNVSHVEYRVDPTLLEEYNHTNGTSYKLLPDTCYWMDEKNFDIDDEAKQAKFKMMYSPESIIASGGHYGEIEFALPVRLWVNGEAMSTERGSVIVAFKVYEPLVKIERSGLVEEITDFEGMYKLVMPFSVNYNNREWITLGFEIDNEFVEEYNRENGTDYLPFPQDNPDNVTWIAGDGELEREVNKDSLSVYANMDVLNDTCQYMLAIKLDSVSTTKAKIDPENCRRYVIFAKPAPAPYIDQSKWRVSTSSVSSGNAANLADGSMENYWVWSWSKKQLPENIDYTLKRYDSLAVVSQIELHARRESDAWLGPKDMEIYVTSDGTTWEKVTDYQVQLAEDGAVNTKPYRIYFPEPVVCVGVRISITSYYSDGIGFNEIYMCGEMKYNPDAPVVYDIPQESWKVTTSSYSSGSADMLNDYGYSEWWLWSWSGNKLPENITYTLVDQSKTATVDSIRLYPGIGNNTAWRGPKTMLIQIDKDGSGTNWETVKTFEAPDLGGDPKWETGYTIALDEAVECKAIRISIQDYWSDGIAFYEIVMYGKVE